MSSTVIALAGNPNVGKSSVFNALTGLHQHTGNWTGKTVDLATGSFSYKDNFYTLVDLPGTHSLFSHCGEEEIARDFLCRGTAALTVVVCDATCLERSLNLVLQIQSITPHVIICLNLCDEASKKGISINTFALSQKLHAPVIETSATKGYGLEQLRIAIHAMATALPRTKETDCFILPISDLDPAKLILLAEEIATSVITLRNPHYDKRDRQIDRFVTGKVTGLLCMLLLLIGILWLTMVGSNKVSSLLSAIFHLGFDALSFLSAYFHFPTWISDPLIFGVYQVLTWVIAVMLPPMAIFFPLFTLLEDLGYLPRIAFNLDHCFKRCHACGKQALTTCMGLGCNAVGVTGCRIIDSPRERLIAILTNTFVPCNGRFPSLLTMISIFFLANTPGWLGGMVSALCMAGCMLLSLIMTFLASRFLSCTVLKGHTSAFVLELPPYRRPQIRKTLLRSFLNRTIFVLGRAVLVAAPAGLFIWILANIPGPGYPSWLQAFSTWLDPLGRLMGLDGVILLSFILGFPANEIVLPIALMIYLQAGTLVDVSNISLLSSLLTANGWTKGTALSFLLFCLFHWPCSTTCLTIKKETGSWRWMGFAILLPTVVGVSLCILVATALRLIGIS